MAQLFGIRSKLFISFLAVGILGIAGIGIGSFYITKNYLQAEAFDQLTSLREIKQQQIEAFFDQARDQVDVFSQDLMIVDAMRDFKSSFFTVGQDDQFGPEQLKKMTEKLKKFYREVFLPELNANLDEKVRLEEFFEGMQDSTTILQNLYIVDNPYPDQRMDYDRAPDNSTYTKMHAKYNPVVREYLSKFAYYDLFLIDTDTGYVVYNASKEIDFAANITKGAFKKTNLAQGFFEMQESSNKDFVKFLDFQYYAPSHGMPSAFVMAPIYDGDKKIGVLALQLNIEEINKIMTNDKKWKATGLGNTGESYIIGDDYKMRSDSRFLIQNPDKYYKDLAAIEVDKNIIEKMRLLNTTILIQDITTDSAQEVMRGNSDTRIITDYRGVPNISSYTPLHIKDAQWGIIAEMDHEELLITVRSVAWKLVGIGFLILLILGLLSFFFIHILLRPLYQMDAGLQLVNRENHLNLRERLPVDGSDVVAQMSKHMNEIFAQMQKGLHALMQAKKEIGSSAGKAQEGVQRSLAMAQSVGQAGKEKKGHLQGVVDTLSELKVDCALHGSLNGQLQQFTQNMQVASVSINRVIESLKASLNQKEASAEISSLRVLLDEGVAADGKIQSELSLIEKKLKESTELSKKSEKQLFDLNEALGGVAALGTSVAADSKKAHKALEQVDAAIEKIKQAIAEFETTARRFTI